MTVMPIISHGIVRPRVRGDDRRSLRGRVGTFQVSVHDLPGDVLGQRGGEGK